MTRQKYIVEQGTATIRKTPKIGKKPTIEQCYHGLPMDANCQDCNHSIKGLAKNSGLKLSELQNYKIQEALQKANRVLQEIKSKPLKGKELEAMKTLERAVSELELFAILCAH